MLCQPSARTNGCRLLGGFIAFVQPITGKIANLANDLRTQKKRVTSMNTGNATINGTIDATMSVTINATIRVTIDVTIIVTNYRCDYPCDYQCDYRRPTTS